VTTRFVEATRLVRKKQKVDGSCFERTALGKPSSSSGRAPTSSRRKQPA